MAIMVNTGRWCRIYNAPCTQVMWCDQRGECVERKTPLFQLSPEAEQQLGHAPEQPPIRTAQVIRWRGVTKLDIAVEQVLEGAQDLKCAVVLGYDKEDNEYFASSIADGADVLWLLERLKLQLLNTGSETDEG